MEHETRRYSYKGHELICGAQPMEDGSCSASLMVRREGLPASTEQVVPLSAAPFTNPDQAIAHALLNGRHWVDQLA